MHHSVSSLEVFFQEYTRRNEPLVLATIVQTIGSTYRKAGAHMLIAKDGSSAGLLSGGCLENDLAQRAQEVLRSGSPALAHYDSRSSDDLIWGLGLGCEGAMTILLIRIDPSNDYQPYSFHAHCRATDIAGRMAFVIASSNPCHPIGAVYRSDDGAVLPALVRDALAVANFDAGRRADRAHELHADGAEFLISPVELPPRLIVLGAGPDAIPLVEVAGLMNWHVTVLDHRPAYAIPQRFPRAQRVAVNPADALAGELQRSRYDAAIVMSHHLLSDQLYLATLAQSTIGYVGLLGPAPRRERLLREIGADAHRLADRLYGPIGLDIGARTPETIALAIVSEIQAVLAGRSGKPFRETTMSR